MLLTIDLILGNLNPSQSDSFFVAAEYLKIIRRNSPRLGDIHFHTFTNMKSM